jgi:putative addiction module killer protein
MYEIVDYLTQGGADPFLEWVRGLSDRQARARVLVRVQRMASGNFGDYKQLSNGVCELRIDYGPGYRVYYARVGSKLILLLVGGDKRKQQVDIETAVAYLRDWKWRNHHE